MKNIKQHTQHTKHTNKLSSKKSVLMKQSGWALQKKLNPTEKKKEKVKEGTKERKTRGGERGGQLTEIKTEKGAHTKKKKRTESTNK